MKFSTWTLLVITSLSAVLFAYLEITGLPNFPATMWIGKWLSVTLATFAALFIAHQYAKR